MNRHFQRDENHYIFFRSSQVTPEQNLIKIVEANFEKQVIYFV